MKMALACIVGIALIVGFGEGFDWVIPLFAILAVAAAMVLVVGSMSTRGFSPQMAHVHVDTADERKEARRVETHEVGGHMKAARKLGGRPVRVNKYTVRPNLPKDAPMEHYVAFYHAGRVAQGSRAGCEIDEDLEKYAASFAPKPGKALRTGRALARRLV